MTKIFFIRNRALPELNGYKTLWRSVRCVFYVAESATPLPNSAIPVAIYNEIINQCLLLLDEPQYISIKQLKDLIQRNVKKEIKYFLDW